MINRLAPRGYTTLISAYGRRATKSACRDKETDALKFAPAADVKMYRFVPKDFYGLEGAHHQLTELAPLSDRYIIRAAHIEGLDLGMAHQRLLADDGRGGLKALEPTPRAWARIDFDGVFLGEGFERPDRFVDGAAVMRDFILGGNFEGVACIASVSAKTSFSGDGRWRGTLTFMLSEPVPDKALEEYFKTLKVRKQIELDPCLARATQANYTGRCLFPASCRVADPFPQEQWVQLIPPKRGCSDVVEVNAAALTEKYGVTPLVTTAPRVVKGVSPSALVRFEQRAAAIGLGGDGTWHDGVVSAIACAAELGVDLDIVQRRIAARLAQGADPQRQLDYGPAYVERTFEHYDKKSAAKAKAADASLSKLNAILNRRKAANHG
jgi:hypothetical protein